MNPIVRSLLILAGVAVVCAVLIFMVRPSVQMSRTFSGLPQGARAEFDAWATSPIGVDASTLNVALPPAEFEEAKKVFFEAWNAQAERISAYQPVINDINARNAYLPADSAEFVTGTEEIVVAWEALTAHPAYALEDMNLLVPTSPAAAQTLPVFQFMRNTLYARGMEALYRNDAEAFTRAVNTLMEMAETPAYPTIFVDALRWSFLGRVDQLLSTARGIVSSGAETPERQKLAEAMGTLKPVVGEKLSALKTEMELNQNTLDQLGMIRTLVKNGELKTLPTLNSNSTGLELFEQVVQKPGTNQKQNAASTYALTYSSFAEHAREKSSVLKNLEYWVSQP